jgi:hypothetical protein
MITALDCDFVFFIFPVVEDDFFSFDKGNNDGGSLIEDNVEFLSVLAVIGDNDSFVHD